MFSCYFQYLLLINLDNTPNTKSRIGISDFKELNRSHIKTDLRPLSTKTKRTVSLKKYNSQTHTNFTTLETTTRRKSKKRLFREVDSYVRRIYLSN